MKRTACTCRWMGAVLILLAGLATADTPSREPLLDCPLRDAPYSVDSPLMDVLLNAEGAGALKAAFGERFATLPPTFTATTAPAFSAIASPRNIAAYFKVPAEKLDELNTRLAALRVTERDRIARCARYDNDKPAFSVPAGSIRMLVFEKITGFDHGASVVAARETLRELAAQHGWSVVVSDRGGVMAAETLARFDLVVWNNVSGDVLTLGQRAAFQQFIEKGGGFVGLHGAGGDPVSFWPWYVDTLLGQRFLGHPNRPQFQDGLIKIEKTADPVTNGLPANWTLHDEWYSFVKNPRDNGVNVLATLDEASYTPGPLLAMGADHPIVWKRCVGRGRSFYTAIGHRAEVYGNAAYRQLLKQALEWAGSAKAACGR